MMVYFLMQAGYPTTHCTSCGENKIIQSEIKLTMSPFPLMFYFQDKSRGPHEMEEAEKEEHFIIFHLLNSDTIFNTLTSLTLKQVFYAVVFPTSVVTQVWS